MKLVYRQTSRRALLIGSIVLLPLLLILGLLEWRLVESFVVTSESMVPTLDRFDQVIVDLRDGYQPRLGDVITFPSPENPEKSRLVKRIIGLGGDRLEVRRGLLYRNGVLLVEPYVTQKNGKLNVEDRIFEVPDGHFFAAGDNRNFSFDSFNFGPLPVDRIDGHVLFVYWPPSRFGVVDAEAGDQPG